MTGAEPTELWPQTEDYTRKLIVRIDREPYWDMRYAYDGSIASGPPKDLNNFFDFCGKLAARYKNRVAAYQVWNEPNLAREWGNAAPNPAEYVAMLKGCYSAIKQADPNALVISAGLSPTGNGPPAAMPDVDFLRGMYEAGAAPYFDVLGAHAPGFKAAPETSPDEVAQDAALGGQRFFCFRRVEDLRAIMRAVWRWREASGDFGVWLDDRPNQQKLCLVCRERTDQGRLHGAGVSVCQKKLVAVDWADDCAFDSAV